MKYLLVVVLVTGCGEASYRRSERSVCDELYASARTHTDTLIVNGYTSSSYEGASSCLSLKQNPPYKP